MIITVLAQSQLHSLTPWVTIGVALLSGAIVLLDIFLTWRKRSWASLNDPARLSVTPGRFRPLALAGFPIAMVAIVSAAQLRDSALAPVAAFVGALSILTSAHLSGSVWLGFLGLAGAAAGVVLIPTAWFGWGAFGLECGLCAAGLWMLWLAKFWRQQLLDGRAWTTAGRLIPAAAAVAYLAAAGVFAQWLYITLGVIRLPRPISTAACGALILAAVFVVALRARAMRCDSALAQFAGWLTLISMTNLLSHTIDPGGGGELWLASVLSTAALLGQGSAAHRGAPAIANRAFAFGLFPALAPLLLIADPLASFAPAALGIGFFLFTAVMRLRPGLADGADSPTAMPDEDRSQSDVDTPQ